MVRPLPINCRPQEQRLFSKGKPILPQHRNSAWVSRLSGCSATFRLASSYVHMSQFLKINQSLPASLSSLCIYTSTYISIYTYTHNMWGEAGRERNRWILYHRQPWLIQAVFLFPMRIYSFLLCVMKIKIIFSISKSWPLPDVVTYSWL